MAARRTRLVKRRQALGYSQEDVAAMIGADRTTIGRIERGETNPYPHTRSKLCLALQVTPEELDRLLTPNVSHSGVLHPAHATPGGAEADPHPTGALDMYRRELLRLLSIAGTAAALPGVAEPVSGFLAETRHRGDVRQHADLNAHLWQVFGLSTSKRSVYPLVQDQLRVLINRLNSAGSAAEHRQLCVLACELFQLAGEICFDGNRYADAAHCYTLAASLGREAGAYDQWACALTRHAYVSMYDRQHQEASSILDAAARIAARGDSQLTTRYWVAAVQAEAFAGLRDADSCRRALDAASAVVGRNNSSPGGWLRFDGSRLGEERGTCYLTLQQSEPAAAALTDALHHTPSLRRRGSILTDLAVIGVHRHEHDEVLAHGHAALDAAQQTRSSGYVGRKLHHLQGQLHPLLHDNRIAELHERITHVLTAA